ncbi:hypothetical protein EXIGLDRAFT_615096 [Exidia glandulosa HHB12029]|uniref:CHAT domain-containing protein n=1 Tax=Exidia glandulosa HHB12029 TaxID=1314781 RepID=A0A165HG16_EXIGL|nr:hypothetical protein EXIGLDRAFT_615096 [Exidia glandulosa HHB12029]
MNLTRLQRHGDSADFLEEATLAFRRVLELTPDDHPQLPKYVSRYSHCLRRRLRSCDDPATLREASTWSRCAVELLPDTCVEKPELLAALGSLLMLHGSVDDIQEAIAMLVRATELAPYGEHPEKTLILTALAECFRRRFESDLHPDDCASSVAAASSALRLQPDSVGALRCLGRALLHRVCVENLSASVTDLNDAILHLQHASDIVLASNDVDHEVNIALARSLTMRFRRLGYTAASDMVYAIKLLERAIDQLPDDHYAKPAYLHTLANALGKRYHHSQDTSDAQNAIKAAREALYLLPSSDPRRPDLWVELSFLQRLLEEVTAMYGRIINLIPQVAWLGDEIDRRFELLSSYSERNIVGAAVAHALAMNDVTSALEWFEQGRAVVWTQINGLRTPVDELRTHDEPKFRDLALRLECTAQALENAGNVPGSRTGHQDKVEEHRRLAEDYRELLDEIRRLPGFEKFLLPRSRNELSLAAAHGPVACINMHSSRCDALVLYGSELHHVPLPNLSPEVADEWRETLGKSLGLDFARTRESRPAGTASSNGLLGILRQMWAVVVQPIFAVLGWTDGGLVHERRIKWCTRSSLAFLPLHAAGLYNGSALNACDIAVSSYTSTLVALLPQARASAPAASAPPSILMLAQPNAPNARSLPGTEREFEHVQKYFSAPSSTFLLGPEGTTDAVLNDMSKHPYIHLACHGRQGVADPMSSSFLLADGDLSLHKLMEKSFRSGELAFLSACETSKGHAKMPDEAVHLAAGMLAVGYRSVVGTMWSVSDDLAPVVADEFYKRVLQLPTVDGRPDVAYALHIATGVLREPILKEQLAKKEVDDVAFAMWVPFVHFGL